MSVVRYSQAVELLEMSAAFCDALRSRVANDTFDLAVLRMDAKFARRVYQSPTLGEAQRRISTRELVQDRPVLFGHPPSLVRGH
jgi:hypothetical protein